MKKIGLFGGTFDPIHQGHIHIASAFANELALQTVIFLPAGDPYHKQYIGQASAKDRLAMVQLVIDVDERFAVSDCDIVRQGETYTFDTVEIFRQQFPSAKLWWLMGMDSLLQLNKWKNWQKLVRQINIAVAARHGESLHQAPKELHQWLGQALQDSRLKLLNAPMYNISSTDIRQAVAANKPVNHVLNPKVAHYIKQQQLYQK